MMFKTDDFPLKFEGERENIRYFSDTVISAKCLYTAISALQHKTIVITNENLENIKNEIETLSKSLLGKSLQILTFPPYKSSYENISPHQELEIERLKTLWNLIEGKFDVVILKPQTLSLIHI